MVLTRSCSRARRSHGSSSNQFRTSRSADARSAWTSSSIPSIFLRMTSKAPSLSRMSAASARRDRMRSLHASRSSPPSIPRSITLAICASRSVAAASRACRRLPPRPTSAGPVDPDSDPGPAIHWEHPSLRARGRGAHPVAASGYHSGRHLGPHSKHLRPAEGTVHGSVRPFPSALGAEHGCASPSTHSVPLRWVGSRHAADSASSRSPSRDLPRRRSPLRVCGPTPRRPSLARTSPRDRRATA
jgi:hypothetical protein